MRLPIITVPHPTLRQVSQPIKQVDKKVTEFIQNLEETLLKKTNPKGVGLSAPQVDKLWRVFVTLLPEENVDNREDLQGQTLQVRTYINPRIVSTSKKMTLGNEPLNRPTDNRQLKTENREPILEGCLSIPKIYGPVLRHQWIKLRFIQVNQTPDNQIISKINKSNQLINRLTSQLPEKTQVFSGFTARVIQHELDHLDGILFTDRALKQGLPLYEERQGKLIEVKLA